MVATVTGATVHAPPLVPSLRATLVPWQTTEDPVMTAGRGLTVITSTEEQPEDTV